MVDLSIMLKRSLILFFPCLLLTGCGIKGPLYLPPNPNDSYLSRIGQQINEMTGEDTVGAAPADAAQKAQDEALPAEGTDKIRETQLSSCPTASQVLCALRRIIRCRQLTNTYSWVQDKDESLSS